ncbi:hypothetical protein, partial [Arthrobacter sp. M4]|uniref:hypothetical protein n=1 Tax=Arthrobacter sp. M4 TaxID=218160 RepID=UPI001CDD807F
PELSRPNRTPPKPIRIPPHVHKQLDRLRALARAEEAITEELNTEELSRRRGSQPVRFGGNEAHALAVSEVAT